jgi:translocator protein
VKKRYAGHHFRTGKIMQQKGERERECFLVNQEYLTLKMPSFAPPGWIFGPVWTILYVMMAAAAFRIYRLGWDRTAVRTALAMFAIQLFFNLMWTPLFFGWQMRGGALLDIILLLVFLIITTHKFYQLDHWAGYLLMPYIIWTAFASVLNLSFWYLNR